MATKPSRNGHLPINGLSLYHEVHGELGRSWVSAFAGQRTVIVFDQQGHGRTPDTSREMSYQQFADGAAALLRALQVERADVMGYSQGGEVALQLALRHPALVSKLVSLSATYRKDGLYPSLLAASRVKAPQRLPARPSRGRSRSTRRTPRRSTPTSKR